MQKTKISKKPSSFTIINLGLIISLGNCCFAYAAVCLSEIEKILQVHNNLTKDDIMYQLSFTTSSLNFGAIIGSLFVKLGGLLYKKFEDHFGTLHAFTFIDTICLFFLGIQLLDLNLYNLVFGRFFYGLFITMSLAMTPSFLNRMSKTHDPSIKGILGSFNQLMIAFGIVLAYIMAYILPNSIEKPDFSTAIKWRIYLGLPIFFLLIRLKAVFAYPEYKTVDQASSAEDSSLQILQLQHHQKQKLSYNKRQLVAILIIASKQMSCIGAIFYYAKQIMDVITDGKEQTSKMLMLFLAFGQLLAAMMSGKLLNKFERKKIFLWGQKAIIAILFLCFLFDSSNQLLPEQTRHILIYFLINMHVITFNLTLGSVGIFYCSEILDDLKYVVFTLKCLSLFFALASDIMIQKIGIGTMFMLFAVIEYFLCVYLEDNMKETLNLDKQKIYQAYAPSKVSMPAFQEPEIKPLKNKCHQKLQSQIQEPNKYKCNFQN